MGPVARRQQWCAVSRYVLQPVVFCVWCAVCGVPETYQAAVLDLLELLLLVLLLRVLETERVEATLAKANIASGVVTLRVVRGGVRRRSRRNRRDDSAAVCSPMTLRPSADSRASDAAFPARESEADGRTDGRTDGRAGRQGGAARTDLDALLEALGLEGANEDGKLHKAPLRHRAEGSERVELAEVVGGVRREVVDVREHETKPRELGNTAVLECGGWGERTGEWPGGGATGSGRRAVAGAGASTNLELRLAVPLDRLERHVCEGEGGGLRDLVSIEKSCAEEWFYSRLSRRRRCHRDQRSEVPRTQACIS